MTSWFLCKWGKKKYFSEVPKSMLNLNIHTSYVSHSVNYSHEYVTFWCVWNIRTTNYEILIGTTFSQMPNFRCVKNLHVFVISVKNLFEFFTCVTNTCEFFTPVTASFECESQTNLSHVWKNWTYLSHMWRICATFSQMWEIRVNPRLCEGLARIFQMWQIHANPSLLWKTRTNLSHL